MIKCSVCGNIYEEYNISYQGEYICEKCMGE